MRITVLAVGSRGDVQPYIALCAGLRAAGHEPRLATHASFRHAVESRGLEFRALTGDPNELIQSRDGTAWLESGESMLVFLRRFLRLFRPLLGTYLDDVRTACQGTEAIIFAPLAFAGWHVAEALRVPCWMGAVQPATPTRAFPAMPLAGSRSLGRTLNLVTHAVYQQLGWQALRPALNQWRRNSLGLRPLPLAGPFKTLRTTPALYGFSSLVLPKPGDWPEWCDLTGYWVLDRSDAWEPPGELIEFLAGGLPPVYVGFGSMVPRDPEETWVIVLGALRRAGFRGILATGWMGRGRQDVPDDVLVVDEIPHDWLFPRVAAVVHHGGAGTTAAALRAGRPAVVVPFFADQPFWAQRVAALGVGPEPIPHKRLSVDRLARAIRTAVSDCGMIQRATGLGAQLRAEDGVENAVAVVNRALDGPHATVPQGV